MLTRFLRPALLAAAAVLFAVVPSLGCASTVARSPHAPHVTYSRQVTHSPGTSQSPGTPAVAPTVPDAWRATQFLPSATVGGLSAPGARDAWLAGDVCGADSLCDRAFVRHWDGTSWRALSLPAAVTATVGEYAISAVTASSASNAWVFDERGLRAVHYTTALHWTGSGWAAPARLDGDVQVAVAPSARDAWAFGARIGDPQGGFVAHFDGQAWSHASFPVEADDASAVSAGDVWVGGTPSGVPDGQAVIEHWNGRAWRDTPLPRLGIAPRSWIGLSITAMTARDAWAVVTAWGPGDNHASYLLRWTGQAWTRVALPCPGSVVSPIVADGHGGAWLVTATTIAGPSWFCHDADGRWTKSAVPARAGEQPGIDHLAWIPGTTSLWATGGFSADAGEVILKYQP